MSAAPIFRKIKVGEVAVSVSECKAKIKGDQSAQSVKEYR